MQELTDATDRYDFLLEHGVFEETDDGQVAVTESFDAAKRVYHDTYAEVDDATFQETIADLFELSIAQARDRIDSLGITRSQLIAYLTLQSYLDDQDVTVDGNDLVVMAGMVADVAPVSPVPDEMVELTDDDYESFLASNPDTVIFVWKLHCEPCEAMKTELDQVRAHIPDGVAVAGVDGESVNAFRREFEVSAAPATMAFVGGELYETLESRRKPERLAELFDEAY
ncbi:thioredoxin family protein [Halosegnis sp.]|uniref:thioredoxin family protein n=1 Tax=Halosegnis sp. TaxID=2864959 RepID=UPI0035D3F1D5